MKRVFSIAVALIASCIAFSQTDLTQTIAVINGEELKGAEYYRRMEYLPNVGRIMGGNFVESTPGFWTLEQLITERLIMGLAKEKNVLPTAAEVQAELRSRLDQDPKLLEDWTASGQTRAELERQIMIQVCQFKIATLGITVTDQEVEKFYKDNPSMFTVPKRFKLRVITVTDEAKKAQVDIQLQSKPFAEVAKAMSDDIVTKADGGFFGTVPDTSLNEIMRKAIEGVKIGGTTSWLKAQDQHLKFQVEDILPSSVQTLDDRLRRNIRRRMMLDRGRIKNDVSKMLKETRAKMKIEIKRKDLRDEYDRISSRYGEASGPAAPKPN